MDQTFDTHGFIKDLQNAGISENQAEVLVKGFQAMHEAQHDTLATKEYIGGKIDALRAEVFKWTCTMLLAQVAVFTAIVAWILG